MGRKERTADYFRKRLRDERERRDWSQADMAKRLGDTGFHATTIAKIEAGDRTVRIDEAAAIADLFGLSTDSMLGRRSRSASSDLAAAVRTMQEHSGRAVYELGAIMGQLRERVGDVLAYEFEGSNELTGNLRRFGDALAEAQESVYAINQFEPPKNDVTLKESEQ